MTTFTKVTFSFSLTNIKWNIQFLNQVQSSIPVLYYHYHLKCKKFHIDNILGYLSQCKGKRLPKRLLRLRGPTVPSSGH